MKSDVDKYALSPVDDLTRRDRSFILFISSSILSSRGNEVDIRNDHGVTTNTVVVVVVLEISRYCLLVPSRNRRSEGAEHDG